MTLKRLMRSYQQHQREGIPCHVCGWKIDISDYYEVTKGQYGGNGTCYYHIRCYPPYKRCKEFRIYPETYELNSVDRGVKQYFAEDEVEVTYPLYMEGVKKLEELK